jgi:hypothetical protein
VTMRNGVFWDVTPRGSCELGTSLCTLAIYSPTLLPTLFSASSILNSILASHLVFLRSMRRLLVTASVVPSSLILVTLMKEALSTTDTSFHTRATWRNIPEDTIPHSSENWETLCLVEWWTCCHVL